MPPTVEILERRTSADAVFDFLHEEIVSLALLPGTKISEAEMAAKFGVSRQPVRDAFSKLDNMNLLLIRPQKATVVKKFSLASIASARFVRLSVELEIASKAAKAWDGHLTKEFENSLSLQSQALKSRDIDEFHKLDYEFHKLMCKAAGCEFAFDIISENKAQVDRLCVLSLTAADGMEQLVKDHNLIVELLFKQDEVALCAALRQHLSRLDATVEKIYQDHASFFSD
jgi:DNA-binding GntR family transcriptional regulator